MARREYDELDYLSMGAFALGVTIIAAVFISAALKQRAGFVSDDLYKKAPAGDLTGQYPSSINGVL